MHRWMIEHALSARILALFGGILSSSSALAEDAGTEKTRPTFDGPPDLVRWSEVIAVVEVGTVTVVRGTQEHIKGDPYRQYIGAKVSEVLKGSPPSGFVFLAETSDYPRPFPSYQKGEKVLAFLWWRGNQWQTPLNLWALLPVSAKGTVEWFSSSSNFSEQETRSLSKVKAEIRKLLKTEKAGKVGHPAKKKAARSASKLPGK